MNIELLRRIARKIRQFPRTVHMDSWAHKTRRTITAPCGTVGCIAGNAMLLSLSPNRFKKLMEEDQAYWDSDVTPDDDPPFLVRAREKLDLTGVLARRLFFTDQWPADFRLQLAHAENDSDQQQYANVVAERIEHFISTKGVDHD